MRRQLQTGRLRLRSFEMDDTDALVRLAGERGIADTMISVPHPFTADDAMRWIGESNRDAADSSSYRFAIVMTETDELIGCVTLRDIDREHLQAEISFWIGKPFRGCKFASEAIKAVIAFSFSEVGLNRIYAHHMIRNPAAGRVLNSVGFIEEGVLRARVRKWGVFEDVAICSLLKTDGFVG